MLDRLPPELLYLIATCLRSSEVYSKVRLCNRALAVQLPPRGYCERHRSWGIEFDGSLLTKLRVMHTCSSPPTTIASFECRVGAGGRPSAAEIVLTKGASTYTVRVDDVTLAVKGSGVERAFLFDWQVEINRFWATVTRKHLTHTPVHCAIC